ncbi:hypothetical protein [Aquitalea sp. LB_tupeE]|uniref:hypothetical protein n=1 Tax=Aquitalea sp. LB_tupeE TaxID=2748078 RepID=UPI0015B858E8|nr:hypothetical protein [Aquitalea sp. LB_tupeE]NWK80322.1 hypothetical protein [Aquitalea sp. LB_tupeE]
MSIVYGYHSTERNAALSIVGSTFRPSTSEEEWLGHAVYFFLCGELKCAVRAGIGWGRYRKHKQPVLLETIFDFDDEYLVDLRNESEIAEFNKISLALVDRLYSEGMFPRDRNKKFDKTIIFNMVLRKMRAQAVIKNEHIASIESGNYSYALPSITVPNCTIMGVRDINRLKSNRILTTSDVAKHVCK